MSTKLFLSKKNYLINVQSILFILLPVLLITGPFLSDLAVSLIAIIFFIQIIKRKEFNFLNNNLFKIFVVFWIYLILNSLFQNQNLDSLRISFFHIRFGLFVFAIVYLLEHNIKILRYFFFSLLICMIILLIDGFIQFTFEKNLLGFELADGPRVSSFFGDELILGSYVSRLLPILAGIFILIYMQKIKKNLFIYFFIFYLLLESLIFISGERTAFFYFILSSGFIFFLVSILKKIRIFIFIFSVFFLALTLLISPNLKHRMLDLTLSELGIGNPKKLEGISKIDENTDISKLQLSFEDLNKSLKIYEDLTFERIQQSYDLGLITQGQKEGLELDLTLQKQKIVVFSAHHTEHFVTALRMFKDNIFFGVGVKNFRIKCKESKYRVSAASCSTHPHNSYIQLLSETGILGFIYFSTFFCIFLFYTFKHIRLVFQKKALFNDFEICMLAAILITIWPLAPTGNIFNNWLNIIFHIPVGLFLWSRKKSIKKINL